MESTKAMEGRKDITIRFVPPGTDVPPVGSFRSMVPDTLHSPDSTARVQDELIDKIERIMQ